MANHPETVSDYIAAAAPEAQVHLRQLRAILSAAAPQAQETIKWGHPFYVEPRFLFAFSAHKAHLSFAPGAGVLEAFADQLTGHATTKNYLKLPYAAPVPEALVRRMAEHRVALVAARADDGFW